VKEKEGFVMNRRANEVKRRLAQRKKLKLQRIAKNESAHTPSSYERIPMNNEIHPLFNKDVFLMKIFAAIILFLVVGIVFKNDSPQFLKTQTFVNEVFEKDFQFATVAKWYEDKFGMPLALIPASDALLEDEQSVEDAKGMEYAIPASGHVLMPFNQDGRGLMIETGEKSQVKAVKDGIVIYIGERDDIGTTVIIDHPGGGQTWYGKLESIEVNKYDYVKTGTVVGIASKSKTATKGEFYFAIKQEDTFIDPIQVIKFD
jgi:stage IV sporulation protein FA